MAQTLACELDQSHRLDASRAEDIFREAIARGATVWLLVSAGEAEKAAEGVIVAQDRTSLTLRLRDGGETPAWLRQSNSIRVTIQTHHASYHFETSHAPKHESAGAGCVRVVRPQVLSAIERRRSPRKSLYAPSEVVLSLVSGPPFSCNSILLNLSAEGVACRLSAVDAERFCTGSKVRARFRVDGESDAFDLLCRVINETQGGTLDTLVLGMTFAGEANSPDVLTRLRSAVRNAG